MALPIPTNEMTMATNSPASSSVGKTGQLNLTMAQIAGITIAAAALLILTVGIFSCIFFVRKRNKRLEQEDRKILMGSTPKLTTDTQDMQDMQDYNAMYFAPPPMDQGKRKSRETPRFSIRKRSKEVDEEKYATQVQAISQPQRTWPRYYPIMPDQTPAIGIATTTNRTQPVRPARSPTYTPTAALSGTTTHTSQSGPRGISPVPKFSLSRKPSTTLPSYQPHSSYAPAAQRSPQQPAPAYVHTPPPNSYGGKHDRIAGTSRGPKAFSSMTNIEEGEQISTRKAAVAGASRGSTSDSSETSSLGHSKRTRRPTLTINIPGQPKPQTQFPPPPPAKKLPGNLPKSVPAPPIQAVMRPIPTQPPRLPLTVVTASKKTTPPQQQQPKLVDIPAHIPAQQKNDPTNSNVSMKQQQVSNAGKVRTPPSAQQVPRTATSNGSAPMLQALASRASQRSAARPKPSLVLNIQKPDAPKPAARPVLALNTQKPVATGPVRPQLLREDQVNQIANSPSDILKAANSYARARKPSPESTSRDSVSSAALPSSNVLGPTTFLMPESDRNTRSRSNSSVRRASRNASRGGRRSSDASVTSFEDDCSCSEDETPPKEENRSLSPVMEASPGPALRYPKVPRQANQVVPRSPGTPKNSNNTQPASPARQSTQTTASTGIRPEVNTSAAAAIGNRLWKTELSPCGKPPHRRSDSWEKWAQSTPDSALPPKPAFAASGTPKLTPTRRGDELFLDLRFSASSLGPVSPKRA